MTVCAPLHVIVADDDESVRVLTARIVRRLLPEATISAVDNGADALRIFDERGAELLITDYMMPEMDGAELIEALRARGALPPSLLITAAVRIPPELRGYTNLRILSKPFDIDQLEAAILGLAASLTLLAGK